MLSVPLIESSYRMEYLAFARDWVLSRNPPNASDLLAAIERRKRELARTN